MHALPLIVGNWKMYGSVGALAAYVSDLARHTSALAGKVEPVLCPPALFIPSLAPLLHSTTMALGGQDCHAASEGAHTGDISAKMLKEAGCRYVIVGHSERRSAYHETSATVRAKAEAARAAGLIPIICVGESLDEREKGIALKAVETQTRESVPEGMNITEFLLAYEPVWAIGSGHTPEMSDIAAMHAHLMDMEGFLGVRVLYGGSVKPANAREILSIQSVAGALVGGSSLKADDFGAIITAACGG